MTTSTKPKGFEVGHKKLGGRKKGVQNKLPIMIRTKNMKVRVKALKGLTPLEVMLDNMRYGHGEAEKLRRHLESLKALEPGHELTKEERGKLSDLVQYRAIAQKAAAEAAPYLHNKLTSIVHSGPQGGPIQTVDKTPPERRRAALALLLAKIETAPINDIPTVRDNVSIINQVIEEVATKKAG